MRLRIRASAAIFAAAIVSTGSAAVERPPQYVAIAFDNCTELYRWQEWADFAAAMNADGDRVHFTFFVSGVNFISMQSRAIYEAPHEKRGTARINFGGTPADVAIRVRYMNELRRRGHEIASHAVGHFDGRTWSAADWKREFDAFDDAFRNVAAHNGLPPADGFAFPPADIVGFRAPYLATSPGLFETMRAGRFRYHANGGVEPDHWPAKENGLWRFSLANIRLAGMRRRTLSMDYNFLVAQSFGLDDSRNRDLFRRQMLQSYFDYFAANYAGNRAPVHIGHHFSDYQRGAYREALQIFARSVCGLPEVRCVTYAALADFMDGLDEATLAAYRRGDFPRAAAPALDSDAFAPAPPVTTVAAGQR